MSSLVENITALSVLQSDLNDLAFPAWRTSNLAWMRAITHEAVEIQEHMGWKWWKKQTPNRAQAFMEVVDIVHFWLSACLVAKFIVNADMLHQKSDHDIHKNIDTLIHIASHSPTPSHSELRRIGSIIVTLTFQLGYTEHDLINWRIGKNALHKFRQDHGYKQGAYIKIWNGKEDNERLVDLIEKSNSNLEQDTIYSALNYLYQTLNTK